MMKQKNQEIDIFLLFIGDCQDKNKLTDQRLMFNTLKELTKLVKMNFISDPIVNIARRNPGLEGYIPIDTSNITLSTYIRGYKIVGCIHSCMEFDALKIVEYVKNKFSCRNIKYQYLNENQLNNIYK